MLVSALTSNRTPSASRPSASRLAIACVSRSLSKLCVSAKLADAASAPDCRMPPPKHLRNLERASEGVSWRPCQHQSRDEGSQRTIAPS